MKSMKVLIISYDFYPDSSPNTYRWLNVLKEWRKKDVEIHVLSYKKPGFNDYEELNGIKIYRVRNKLVEKIKDLTNKDNNTNSSSSRPSLNKSLSNKSILKRIYDNSWKKLYFPDFAFLWKRPAIKKAKDIISKNNIYNVITVSWPFTDHVIGYELKKILSINWIADTIDPFYLSKAVNNNFIYNSLNYKYEKKILSLADNVSLLTNKLKQKYSSLYPSVSEKLVVNYNIFIPYGIKNLKSDFKAEKVKLVFLGTLSPITRPPDILLELFNNILNCKNLTIDVELHFFGNLGTCISSFKKYNFLINKNLFINGPVPREEVFSILNGADILVNIGNNNEYQEPSKILEYIYLQKRILNVFTLKNDSSKELLSDYNLKLNVHVSEINNSQVIKKIINFFINEPIINQKVNVEILEKYLINEVEKRYFELLK